MSLKAACLEPCSFEHHYGWRWLFWHAVPVFDYIYSLKKKKKVNIKYRVFQPLPVACCLSLGTTGKSPVMSYTFLSCIQLKSPKHSLLKADQPFLLCGMLQSFKHVCSLHWSLSSMSPCCSWTGELRTGHRSPAVTLPGLSREERSPLSACWQHSLM